MNLRSGEWAASDEDYEKAYKTPLESCKNDCNQDEKCNAIYYTGGFCFMIYKKTPTIISYDDALYFDKVCNHTYSKFLLLPNNTII